MADVYLAVARGPLEFQKLVVLKLLRAGYVGDREVRAMFLDEARLAARLNHANVVDTYEVGDEEGTLFLAMEYLEGQPLSAIAAESRLCGERTPVGLALRIVSDALNGLHYAHELADFDGTKLHIVHRDVSPHNIFITYDGRVKLMDFGIAKAIYSAPRTDAGTLKGKVRYMAPEQAMGLALDRRADVFAMGICLWELLSGEPLLPVNSPMSALHKLTNEPMPPLATVLPGVDPDLEAIVARALAREPEDRWPTAAAMREAIDAYARQAGIVAQQDDVAKHMASAFEELREQVRNEVSAEMARLGELQSEGTDPARQRKLGAIAARERLLDLARRSVEPTSGGGSATHGDARASARRRRRTLLVAVAAPFALALAALVAVGASRKSETSGTAASAGPAPGARPGAPGAASGAAIAAPGRAGDSTSGAAGSAAIAAVPPAPSTSAGAATPTAPSAPVGAGASPAPHAAHSAAGSAGRPRPAGPGAAVAPPKAGRGALTLDTYPWSRVSEGGRQLGVTPLVEVSLPAGDHTLLLESPETNARRTITVTIRPGETLSKRVALD